MACIMWDFKQTFFACIFLLIGAYSCSGIIADVAKTAAAISCNVSKQEFIKIIDKLARMDFPCNPSGRPYLVFSPLNLHLHFNESI